MRQHASAVANRFSLVIFPNPRNHTPRKLFVALGRRLFLWVGLLGLLASGTTSAQILDCNCLRTNVVLFTNACSGVIPDLCPVATNCYTPTVGAVPGYTCNQTPIPGTVVSSSTPITFWLIETSTGISNQCQFIFQVGLTNAFTLLCPTNQSVPCGTTTWSFPPPTWTNTCCAAGSILLSSTTVTNWPVITTFWTAIDCNGISYNCNQSITFVGPCATNCLDIVCPSNIVVQTCLSPFPIPGATTNIFFPFPIATNNYCIGTITNMFASPPSGSPFPVGTNTVTWTVQDNLGNSASCSFDVIVLGDTTPPVVFCGTNQTVQCGTPWSPIPPTGYDVCCTNTAGTTNSVFIMLLSAVTNSAGPCLETIEFIWHVNDCNGNFVNCTNTVTIIDTTPPIIACNSNQTYQCSNASGVPGSWQPVPPTAFDLCCGTNVTVSLFNAVTNGSIPCNEIITFIWQATDCCTNTAYCTETITITDTNPPVIVCAPFKIVECGSGWTFDPPTAFDLCCGTNVTINVLSNLTVFSSICSNVFEQFWMATDCCTNQSAVCSQRVIELDTTPPVMTCASNFTVQCGTPFVFTPPTAVDACCPPGSTIISVLSVVTNVPANCPTIITTTWRAMDCCGNSTNCSQTVTIVDTVPPVITCPPNQLVQCGTAWTNFPATATDACCTNSAGGAVNVILSATVTNIISPCQEVIAFVWLATDCCGNHASCTNFVTITDTLPPVIACNSNQTYQCSNASGVPGSWQPVPPTAFDLCCGTNVTVSLFNAVTNGSIPCNEIITFTWQAVDCCTNFAYCTETITITDTNPPVIVCAPFKVVECGSGWTFDPPTVFDLCCGTNVTINVLSNVTVFASGCSNIFEQFWMATDCCTNQSAVCSQRVIELDTTPPAVNCGTNFTIACGTPFVFTPPTAVDACCPPAGITITNFSIVTNALSVCPVIITCNWRIMDCCGNMTNCSQTVTIVDTVPPVIVCGPDQIVQCGTPWSFNPPTVTDNCCTNSTGSFALFNTTTNSTGPCSEVITVEWRATDCCGNTAACTNYVTVIDTTPPVISCKTNIPIVQCGDPIIPPPAVDNCCPAVTVSLLSSATNVINSCRYFVTNTWSAVDCCTNTATCVETIMITDTTPPVITCASNKTVQCGVAWSFDLPTAIDSCCGTNVAISSLGIVTNSGASSCLTIITQTWQAVDCCTNIATCSQVVTIADTTPPTMFCAPPVTVPCGTSFTFTPPTAVDNCCPTASIVIAVVSTVTNLTPNCPKVITRTWSATDCCGNSNTCSSTVAITDSVPPFFTFCPPNFTVTSGTPWSFGTPVASDACCLSGIVIVSTTTNVNGAACNVKYKRTWRAKDCCGNLSALCSQTVTVNMTTPPPNDLCPNAIPLTVNAGYVCGSNLCATPTPAGQFNPNPPTFPPCGPSLASRDVWYKVVALCNGMMTVDTCQPCFMGPTFDTVLSAYTNNCSQLTQVSASACNDDFCGVQSKITFPVIGGQTYLIRVAGFASLASAGWFSIQATQVVTPPVNDDCVFAIPVGLGTVCGTTICATPSATNAIPAPCGSSGNSPDVWYTFKPPCTGVYRIDTCGNCTNTITPFNTVLSVYSDSVGLGCNLLTSVGCNNNAAGFPPCSPQSRLTLTLTAGVTYYIRVAGNGPLVFGNFQLNVTQLSATPPPNDLCANATAVIPGTYAWYNCGANTDGPSTGICVPWQDVWFSYTPSCSGTVSLSTCSSPLDTVLAVYNGPCTSLGFINCNDDAPPGVGPCGGTQQSYVTFNATAGNTYYIRVGTQLGNTGSGLLTINGPNPAAQACPPAAGTPLCRWFRVTGPGNSTPWAWSITAACCANVTNLNVPGVIGNTNALAAAFVNSINGTPCFGVGLNATAFPSLSIQGIFRVCVTCSTATPWHLAVGPAGTPAANLCVVPMTTMFTPLPVSGGPCNFNPGIVELPTTGQDANGNGIDDGVDIYLGTSADVNGNFIPDETEPCIAPELALNPEPQAVDPGDNVVLTVAVTGTGPFTYQWARDGLPLSDGGNISGAQTDALSIAPVSLGDVGNYAVAVSNACGFVIATPVPIMFEPTTLPVLYDLNAEGGNFSFTVDTKVGFDYVVEYKNDLNDPSWTTLTTVSGSGGPELIFDSEPLPQMRFYRVRRQTGP